MSDVIWLLVIIVGLFALAPLIPPMMEFYGWYCQWVWKKLGVR